MEQNSRYIYIYVFTHQYLVFGATWLEHIWIIYNNLHAYTCNIIAFTAQSFMGISWHMMTCHVMYYPLVI